MYPPFGGVGYGPFGSLGTYGGLVPYGTLELTESSPTQSFDEPLSLPDIQTYLNLPDSLAETQAATLAMFISAAREQAEILQNRDLVRKQWDLSFDYWPGYRIALRPHLFSVELMQYTNSAGVITALVENTDFVADRAKKPGVLAPPYGRTWPIFTPWPTGSILIRFTAGVAPNATFWSDAGARVKVGMKYLISGWFTNRIPYGAKVEELPYAVTSCLSYGAVPRAK